uniref:Uncharacterized protein n=1 Tax=Anguilla anguilla TaxID=7936 RepID=A0A0E9VJR1_ANGAN
MTSHLRAQTFDIDRKAPIFGGPKAFVSWLFWLKSAVAAARTSVKV